MKPKINLLTIGLLIIVLVGSIFAQPRRSYLYDKLNLTDQQINQLEKLRDQHWKKMSEYRDELAKMRIDIRAEWRKDNPDKKKIESLMNKMNEIHSKMNQDRLNHWFDIFNLLDEKQKEKFREFQGKFFKDGKFWDRKYYKEYFKKGFGFCPCGMGCGPWWLDDK
ncbi:MAG: Spy/CpxP family protein refolding chaperone [Ignavibacteria bacterium]